MRRKIQSRSTAENFRRANLFCPSANYCTVFTTLLAVCDTNGISSQFLDFGIYGPKMLFITEQYIPTHKGTYYKDETKVKHYHRLFDEVWNSDAITRPNPSNCTSKIDLSDLIS